MKKLLLAGVLALPVPFAALPVIGVVVGSSPASTDGRILTVEFPVAPGPTTIQTDPPALGFRVADAPEVGCGSGLHFEG